MNTTTKTEAMQRDQALAAAVALSEALGEGHGAVAPYLLGGTWYVVTSGTGEGEFAYWPEDLDPDLLARGDWDYDGFCGAVSPCATLAVAVAYYLQTGRDLCRSGSCVRVLSHDQRLVLDIVRRGAK